MISAPPTASVAATTASPAARLGAVGGVFCGLGLPGRPTLRRLPCLGKLGAMRNAGRTPFLHHLLTLRHDGCAEQALVGGGGSESIWAWCPCRFCSRQPPRQRESSIMPTSRVQAFLAHTCSHVPARRVAEILGVAESEISRWRSGDRVPSLDRWLSAVDAVVAALPELAEELLAVGVGPGVAGLVHGSPEPDPEPPSDTNVVDLRAWAERRGRWPVVPGSVGRRAA